MTSQTPHISAMMPSDLTGFEVTTVSTCAEHERPHWRAEEYGRCVVFELKYFVNLDDCETLRPQVATQKHIHWHAKSDANAPRIPEILHFFEIGEMGHAVLEFIKLTLPSISRKSCRCSQVAF